ncbi:MAG: hypothetical protein J6M44_12670 [Butyrivibrio sp.]|nr:hypothetical protein [Butyrivibrio sp.]
MKNPLEKIIRLPYYYVAKCPNCGSYATGRYVKEYRKTEVEWQVDEALKNGELIRMKPDLIGANCFCIDCDKDFSAPVQLKMLPLSEIKAQKRLRHTQEILSERKGDDYHQKKRGVVGLFTNFVGKI